MMRVVRSVGTLVASVIGILLVGSSLTGLPNDTASLSGDALPPAAATRDVTGMSPFTATMAPATIEIVGDDSVGVEKLVRSIGGSVLGSAPGLTLVEIPSWRIGELRAVLGSDVNIRSPRPIDVTPAPAPGFPASLGDGDVPIVTGADDWHAAGFTGEGIRVGIIDYFDLELWNDAQSAGTVPGYHGLFCRTLGSPCDLWTADSPHGVAVAEGVHAMAPDAQLYLATVSNATDLAAAIEWFDTEGVDVITRSLISPFDGPGDGTGPLDAIVDDAVARGMVFLNAAGNHATGASHLGSYWRGSFTDADLDGFLDFAPGDNSMGMFCVPAMDGVRWSDWGGSRTDYDVYITDEDGAVLAQSTSDQTAGADPIEMLGSIGIDCGVYPVVYLWVELYATGASTAGDIIEIKTTNGGLEYSTNPYAAASPISDSANPGVLAIGAVDPGDGTTIASYSSWGPTNDERIKPDLVAPACYPSVAYSPSCFNGTSSASPIVAGATALLKGAGVATTPQTIATYLRSHAIDRGVPGPDNVYGSGQLDLGVPPKALPADAHLLAMIDASRGLWHFYGADGKEDFSLYFGNPGDFPIMGDWDCDGFETPGMYRQSDGYVYLRNSNTQGVADIRFFFGNPGDVPIAGDFNGDGCDTVSIYRPSNQTFYIINALGENDGGLGAAETFYVFGNPGDKPFVGDFDGDGSETVGLHRESTGLVYFRNTHTQGVAHAEFIFGDPGDRIVAGDWNTDGAFSPGLFRPSNTTAYFRFVNAAGNADAQFVPQPVGPDWLVVAGSRS